LNAAVCCPLYKHVVIYRHFVFVDVLSICSSLDQHFDNIDGFTDKERRITLGILDVNISSLLQKVVDQLLVSIGCCGMPGEKIEKQQTG